MNVDVMYSKQLLMEEMLIKIIDKLKQNENVDNLDEILSQCQGLGGI